MTKSAAEISFPPDQARLFLLWLADGCNDMRARGISIDPRELVWDMLAKAVALIEGLPDQEMKWLSSGTRSGGWTMIGMTGGEARDVERARLMMGITPGDSMRVVPTSLDTEKAMAIIEWLRFTRTPKLGTTLEHAGYYLALNDNVNALSALRADNAHYRRPMDKRYLDQMMYQIRNRISVVIVARLEAGLHITFDPEGFSLDERP